MSKIEITILGQNENIAKIADFKLGNESFVYSPKLVRSFKSINKLFEFPLWYSKKDWNSVSLLAMIILALMLIRILIPDFSNLLIKIPFGELVIILLMFIGKWKDYDILRGIGIVSIMDTFVLGAFGFIFGNLWSVIFLIGIIEGAVCFLTKPLRNWKFAFIAAWFYLIISTLTEFTHPLDKLAEYNYVLLNTTKFIAFIFPFFMVNFVRMKESDNFSQKQSNSKGSSKFDQLLSRKLPQHPIQTWQIVFTIIMQIIISFIVNSITHKWTQFITISTWSFTICISICFFRNYKFNSWIVSVIFPMIWLAIFDYGIPSNITEFFNFFFHLLIIAIGLYILIAKRNIRWDYILTFGFSLLLYGFLLNFFIPGYVGANPIGMVYYVIAITLILSFKSYEWVKEDYHEIPHIFRTNI